MSQFTLLNNVSANGAGTALDCTTEQVASFTISGTFNAAVRFEFSTDGGTTWSSMPGMVNDQQLTSVAYAPAKVSFEVGNVTHIRPNVQNYVSGSVTVTGYADVGHQSVTLAGSNVEQTLGAAIPTKANLIGGSDGTNIRAIKVEADGTQDFKITGSNVEQVVGGALPAKAILQGVSDGVNIQPHTGNVDLTLLASATRTSAATSPIQLNTNCRGVIICLNVTAASGTGGLQLRIYAKDPVSGAGIAFNNSPTAIIATGITMYSLYPAIPASWGNISQNTNGLLAKEWWVYVNAGDSSSYTYSVGAIEIV
jgi:hypothetical protein